MGKIVEDEIGDQEAQDRVPEELHRLVVRAAAGLIGEGLVGQGLLQKILVAKAVAEPLFELARIHGCGQRHFQRGTIAFSLADVSWYYNTLTRTMVMSSCWIAPPAKLKTSSTIFARSSSIDRSALSSMTPRRRSSPKSSERVFIPSLTPSVKKMKKYPP